MTGFSSCLNRFRLLATAMLALTTLQTAAHATDKQLIITNRSGEALTSLVVTGRNAPSQPLALTLQLPLAANSTAMATITLPDATCVFDATYTFPSGQNNAQPDLDLCQLDGIIVE